jgi:hypothetical protein
MRGRLLALLIGSFAGSLSAPSALAGEHPSARAAGPASDRILEKLARVATNLRESKYNHATVVDEQKGRYEFDCSGFVTWLLRRTAPGAYSTFVTRSQNQRPLARDYYWEIARAPVGERTPRGVRKISRVDAALPGDIVAWLKPALLQSPHTGHVAFVLEPPQPAPDVPGGFLVRIADASSYQHDADDRYASGRTGFGSGTILLVADPETGEPRAYGWFGLRSRFVLETSIAIGRATR